MHASMQYNFINMENSEVHEEHVVRVYSLVPRLPKWSYIVLFDLGVLETRQAWTRVVGLVENSALETDNAFSSANVFSFSAHGALIGGSWEKCGT